MTYQVLARKWRPPVFDAVIGQDPITRTLRNALASGRVAHAYLFAGPRGVGKTTTARLLAKALACTGRTGPEACGKCPSCADVAAGASVDIIEIDGASNNGVDEIRTLRENVKYAPAHARFKLYIVDEVHMLSASAFNAFLKTLEEPPSHVVFILATTDPRKVPATVLSRCQRFDFKPIPPELLTESLRKILTAERVPFDPAALPLLVRAAEGSLRDALSLLDTAIAYGEGRLDEASVATLLGSSAPVQVRGFLVALLGRDGAAALEAIDRAARAGEDLDTLCRDVIEAARRLLVLKVAPSAPFADLTPAEVEALTVASQGATADDLIYLLRMLLQAEAEMRHSPHPRVELEIAAVRAARRPEPQAIDTLIARVEEAEARVRAAGRSVAVQESLLEPRPAAPAPASLSAGAPISGSSARTAVTPDRPVVRAAPLAGPGAPPAAGLAGGWQRVVEDVMRKRALLGSVLQHATPIALEDGVLRLATAGNHFHKEQLADRANRDLINEALRQHIPEARRFELVEGDAASESATKHPAVQAALHLFQGDVVAVRPRPPEEGERQ